MKLRNIMMAGVFMASAISTTFTSCESFLDIDEYVYDMTSLDSILRERVSLRSISVLQPITSLLLTTYGNRLHCLWDSHPMKRSHLSRKVKRIHGKVSFLRWGRW